MLSIPYLTYISKRLVLSGNAWQEFVPYQLV